MRKSTTQAKRMTYQTSALMIRRAFESRFPDRSTSGISYGMLAQQIVDDMGDQASYQLLMAQSEDTEKYTFAEFCRYVDWKSGFRKPNFTEWCDAFPLGHKETGLVLSLSQCQYHFGK